MLNVFHQKQIEKLCDKVGLYGLEMTNMLTICLDFRSGGCRFTHPCGVSSVWMTRFFQFAVLIFVGGNAVSEPQC